MLATSDVIAFAPTTDLARARTFYENTLGLSLVDENQYACVFDAHGTMLRITAVPEPAAAPYTVLGWTVRDIAAAVDELATRGVRFTRYEGVDQDDRGVWTAPGGARIAWFLDPDRNNLSLHEFTPERR